MGRKRTCHTGVPGPSETQDEQESQRETLGSIHDPVFVAEAVGEAIAAHDADEYRGNYNPNERFHTPLWAFTRTLRSRFPDFEPEEVLEAILPEIEERGGWESVANFDDYPVDDPCVEFVVTWLRVRTLIGESLLQAAYRLAQKRPLITERSAKYPGRYMAYDKFVSVAAHLEILRDDKPIFLPCREVGVLLSCDPKTVQRYRVLAVRDGLLHQVGRHSRVKCRATEFRFNTSRFQEMRRAARTSSIVRQQDGHP